MQDCRKLMVSSTPLARLSQQQCNTSKNLRMDTWTRTLVFYDTYAHEKRSFLFFMFPVAREGATAVLSIARMI